MLVYKATSLSVRYSLLKTTARLFASGGTHTTNGICEDLSDIILTQGVVRSGYGRGSKTLGFPTANLPHFDSELREHSVKRGIYYGWASIAGEKEVFPCVTNIGVSPTFEDEETHEHGDIIEAYILDRPRGRGDFYGSLLRLALVGYLRPEVKYNTIGELVRQIGKDVACTKKLCAVATQSEVLTEKSVDGVEIQDSVEVQQNKLRNLFQHCVRPFLETTDQTFQYSTTIGSQELSLESKAIQSATARSPAEVPENGQPVHSADNKQHFLCVLNVDAILSKLDHSHI